MSLVKPLLHWYSDVFHSFLQLVTELHRQGKCTVQCRGQLLCSRSRMNPQFCSPLPLRPRFVPVVMRPTVPVWYPSITQEQSPVHGVPLFSFALTPDASFDTCSQTTVGVLDRSKGNENLCQCYLTPLNQLFEKLQLFYKLHVIVNI